MRGIAVLSLAAAACTPNYEAEGNKLTVAYGDAPQEIRTPIAKVLHECRVSVSAAKVFPPHGPGAQKWGVQLPRAQVMSKTTDCIDREIRVLGLSSKIAWFEEPPPPPPPSEMQQAYLLVAAERSVEEPPNLRPLAEARKVLPDVLKTCGIGRFTEEQDLGAGVVVLRFDLRGKDKAAALSCVKREAPKGTLVEESAL